MSSTATDSADLRELSDPDFFTRWAEIRLRYATTPKNSFYYPARKLDYEAVVAEYRRRIDGGMAQTA
jgi:hypothetical protein